MRVAGSANSAIFWRQPPQGVQGSRVSRPPATAMAAMRRPPAATMAAMALASAQVPSGNAAFSTLQPVWMRPASSRSAAPTRYSE